MGLNLNDAVWAPSGFTKHRERLLGGDVAQAFSEPVLAQACERHRWSDEHRTVDGPLLEIGVHHTATCFAGRPPAFGSVVALAPLALRSIICSI